MLFYFHKSSGYPKLVSYACSLVILAQWNNFASPIFPLTVWTLLTKWQRQVLSTLATIVAERPNYSRRQFVAEFGDCRPKRRQCGQVLRLHMRGNGNSALFAKILPITIAPFDLDIDFLYKKADELSQRWPRNAPHIGLCMPQKFLGVPDYAHGYFSRQFWWTFVPIDPVNVHKKFEIRSFTPSWDSTGYGVPKTFGQSLDTSTLPFLQNL